MVSKNISLFCIGACLLIFLESLSGMSAIQKNLGRIFPLKILVTLVRYLVQLMVRLKLGIGQPNRVSIPLTTMLIKFVVWPTIMMVQNLCLFQRTKVYICIAYLFDQNRSISKVQNPTPFFNLQKWLLTI